MWRRKGAAVDALAVADLSAEVVRSFLAHLESERQSSDSRAEPATRLDPRSGSIRRQHQRWPGRRGRVVG
jgi:hypothetical protein